MIENIIVELSIFIRWLDGEAGIGFDIDGILRSKFMVTYKVLYFAVRLLKFLGLLD